MEKWPREYPSLCNCQGKSLKFKLLTLSQLGKNHKFFKNCLGCGLIFCQQNSKLSSCTFCSLTFDSPVGSSTESSLEKALNLQSRLLAADLNTASTRIKDDYSDQTGNFLQTKFCPASEITARKRQIEDYKAKLAKEQAEKSSFDLSKMLNF